MGVRENEHENGNYCLGFRVEELPSLKKKPSPWLQVCCCRLTFKLP